MLNDLAEATKASDGKKVMQRRRAADGNGGGEVADARSADEMLEDLMEDLNASSGSTAAVRSVRVVGNRDQAQPEGGTQEVVGAGAVEAQPHGRHEGAQGVMEGCRLTSRPCLDKLLKS